MLVGGLMVALAFTAPHHGGPHRGYSPAALLVSGDTLHRALHVHLLRGLVMLLLAVPLAARRLSCRTGPGFGPPWRVASRATRSSP